MVERRQLGNNSCQVSMFMDENLLHNETFSCVDWTYTQLSQTVTSIYVGDQNYSGTDYGNHHSTRFVLLWINAWIRSRRKFTFPKNITKIAVHPLSVNFLFLTIPPLRSCTRAQRTHSQNINSWHSPSGEPLTVGLFQDRRIYLE